MFDAHDALEMAQLVKRRAVSPLELTDSVINRLERLNPLLNAVITPMYDEARRQAREIRLNAPFAGVPFLVKDLQVFLAGQPMSNGSRALRDFVPHQECDQAQKIREAGLVVLGKTNTPELGLMPITNPKAFGPTCNPWDLSRNSGGSSGGSTAAVAARIVPMASSSDGGGSIRIPAAHCGVFGFKPSRGRNAYNKAWGGAVVSHVTTVSVRDSAAWLDWTSRNISVEKPSVPVPGSFLGCTTAFPRALRIGFVTDSPLGGRVHADCVEAVHRAASLLTDLGHRVEPITPPWNGRHLMEAFYPVLFQATRQDLGEMAERLRTAVKHLDIELSTRFFGEVGCGVSEQQIHAALAEWERIGQEMQSFHTRFDVLLSPVAPTPPLPHAHLEPSVAERIQVFAAIRMGLARRMYGNALLHRMTKKCRDTAPFTPIANVTGQPAMSVPLYWNSAGLPIGVQLVAGHEQDGLLFALAGQLEEAAPWRDKRPPLSESKNIHE